MRAVFSDPSRTMLRSGRASGFSRFADLDQPAGPDVVDEAVDRDPSGDEGMATDPTHVFDDALLAIGDVEPVDILRLRRARPAADVPEGARDAVEKREAPRQANPRVTPLRGGRQLVGQVAPGPRRRLLGHLHLLPTRAGSTGRHARSHPARRSSGSAGELENAATRLLGQ
jgi:hypothetical protein